MRPCFIVILGWLPAVLSQVFLFPEAYSNRSLNSPLDFGTWKPRLDTTLSLTGTPVAWLYAQIPGVTPTTSGPTRTGDYGTVPRRGFLVNPTASQAVDFQLDFSVVHKDPNAYLGFAFRYQSMNVFYTVYGTKTSIYIAKSMNGNPIVLASESAIPGNQDQVTYYDVICREISSTTTQINVTSWFGAARTYRGNWLVLDTDKDRPRVGTFATFGFAGNNWYYLPITINISRELLWSADPSVLWKYDGTSIQNSWRKTCCGAYVPWQYTGTQLITGSMSTNNNNDMSCLAFTASQYAWNNYAWNFTMQLTTSDPQGYAAAAVYIGASGAQPIYVVLQNTTWIGLGLYRTSGSNSNNLDIRLGTNITYTPAPRNYKLEVKTMYQGSTQVNYLRLWVNGVLFVTMADSSATRGLISDPPPVQGQVGFCTSRPAIFTPNQITGRAVAIFGVAGYPTTGFSSGVTGTTMYVANMSTVGLRLDISGSFLVANMTQFTILVGLFANDGTAISIYSNCNLDLALSTTSRIVCMVTDNFQNRTTPAVVRLRHPLIPTTPAILSITTIQFMYATMVPMTLRTNGSAIEILDGNRSVVNSASSNGDVVTMVVQGIPPAALVGNSAIMVEGIVDPCSAMTFSNLINTSANGISTFTATVNCQIPQGNGENLRLYFAFPQYNTGAYSPFGVDQYSYAIAPTIVSMIGCNSTPPDQQPSLVGNCPTSANPAVSITVEGTGFSDATIFMVGRTIVSPDKPVLTNLLTFQLPPGVGFNQRVVALQDIGAGVLVSKPVTISYAAPTVKTVGGCGGSDYSDGAFNVFNCARDGTSQLIITGINFAAYATALPTVFIGTANCANVRVDHDAVSPCDLCMIECDIPSGFGSNRVLLLQSGGEFASQNIVVEYAPCPRGTFEAGVNCTLCSPGTFAPVPGQAECTPCDQGSYANTSGSFLCEPCDAGYYAPNSSSAACSPCILGWYSQSGQPGCKPCSEGTFSNSSASSSCDSCATGAYQSARGQQQCILCELGKVNGAVQQTECVSVEAGLYANRRGLAAGGVCPAGSYSELGAINCTLCPPGRYQPNPGSYECVECLAGRYQPAIGSSKCEDCPSQTYQDSTAAVRCIACALPYTFQKNNGSISCESCSPGLFVPPDTTNFDRSSAEICEVCPQFATCASGRVAANPGYFVTQDASRQVVTVACTEITACLGCMDINSTMCNTCAANRVQTSSNMLCGACNPGYYEWGGDCITCISVDWISLSIIVIFTFFYVVLFHFMAQSTKGDMKVFMYFVQVCFMVVTAHGHYLDWSWLGFFNFDIFLTSHSCLGPIGPASKLLLGLFVPVLFIAELAVYAFVKMLLWLVLYRHKGIKFHKSPYIRTCFGLLLFTYAAVASTSFKALDCIAVGTRRVIRSSPAVYCDDAAYIPIQRAAISLLVLGVFCVPVGLMVFLWRAKVNNQLHERKFLWRYAILYENYRKELWFWEAYSITRRTCLIFSSVVFSPIIERTRQLVLFLSFNVLFVMIQLQFKPFHTKSDNDLETTSLLLLILIVLLLLPFPEPPSPKWVEYFIAVLVAGPGIFFMMWIFIGRFTRVRKFLADRYQKKNQGPDLGKLSAW